ncbi:hypothetical protein Halar_2512 [halophilic archaeon DL31]|jgi:hypothetical protein|nr:hypothetical protein Halar_2512 [halophilic archaeon DL31]
MTLFEYGNRLKAIRTGRFADIASSLAWFVGIFLTVAHPIGLTVGGALLGLTASSVERAFAAGAAFGITLVAAGVGWLLLFGSLPIAISVAPAFIAFLTLLVPPVVAAAVRWLG